MGYALAVAAGFVGAPEDGTGGGGTTGGGEDTGGPETTGGGS